MRRRIDEEGLEPSLKPAWKALEDGEERETEEYHFVSHARLMEEAVGDLHSCSTFLLSSR
jgi:hypothetical protein